MGITRFPHGVSSWGVPLHGGFGPIGVGMGELFYVVAAKTSSDLYYERLFENGVDDDHIFTSLSDAYSNCTSDQNDVVGVLPGEYTVTSSLTWAKDQTHIVGLGGPNMRHCPTTATNGAVRFKCTTASVDSILSVSGHYVQLWNFETQNTYSSNANRCDVQILGKNTYINGCHFRGGNGANQLNHADGGVPLIISSGTAGAGNGFTAENSIFGTSGNSARTVGAGAVLFEGGASAGFSPIFRNCTFEMRCETSGSTDPKLVHLAANYAVDRYLLFDNCLFYNFWENLAGTLDYSVVDACGTTHHIIFKNCTHVGVDYACNVVTYSVTSDAAAGDHGGIAVATDIS